MEGFYAKYRCVKAIELVSVGNEGTLFAGIRVVQYRDYYATVSMDEHVKAKLRPIEAKGYLSNTKEISEGMLTNIKGVNGGLGWLASTGRPDMAATHSISPTGKERKSPQLISEVNAAVKQCHAVPITIAIWSILIEERRWTTFTDSSFDTGERQQGWLVCASNTLFDQERTALVSVLHWRSRKLTRKAGSPQFGGDFCSKFSRGGDVVEQNVLGINDLERFRYTHTTTVQSTHQKSHATCDRQRKSELPRSREHACDGLQRIVRRTGQ